MKSQFFAFSLVLGMVFPILISAQPVHPGIKIGLNLANFYGEDTEGSINAGLLVGGVLHFPVSDKFALQPELLFSQQGSQTKEDNVTVRFNNNYLLLPLMSKIYLNPNIAFEVGPQIGFLLTSRLAAGESANDFSVSTKDMFNTLDVALNAGLSYEWESNWVVGTRYSLGVTNVVKKSIEDVNSKNSVIQLSLARRFQPKSS